MNYKRLPFYTKEEIHGSFFIHAKIMRSFPMGLFCGIFYKLFLGCECFCGGINSDRISIVRVNDYAPHNVYTTNKHKNYNQCQSTVNIYSLLIFLKIQ